MTEVQTLERDILKYRKAYYSGNEMISDAEYDMLESKLRKLDPKNKVLNSIGVDKAHGFIKRKHLMKLGSQEKAADKEEFWQWFTNQQDEIYIAEEKIDGASVELQYKNGTLEYAITRGDGEIGDDITSNIRRIKNIPFTVPAFKSGSIRGEVVLPNSVFRKKYAQDSQNPRNMTAGILKRKTGEGCEDLLFIAYDLLTINGQNKQIQCEADKIQFLQMVGFLVPKFQAFRNNHYTVEGYKETYGNICAFRDSLMNLRGSKAQSDYNYDGIVVKCNTIDQADLNRDKPVHQIAFKFNLEIGISEITGVIWSVSGRRRTPIAVFNPVKLHGTTVSKASLANPRVFDSFDIHIGTTVHVQKSGEIIPYVIRTFNDPDKIKSKVSYPANCEYCNHRLVRSDAELYCPNDDCPEVVLHQIGKWIEKHKIQYIGDTTLRTMFYGNQQNKRAITSIVDLYLLTPESLNAYTGIGPNQSEKIVKQIQTVGKQSTIPKFISGLDIKDIGETYVELIIKDYLITCLDDFLLLKLEEIAEVRGIGATLARNLVDGLKYHKNLIHELRKHVNLKEKKFDDSGMLHGKTICITGAIEGYTRSDLKDIIEQAGGTFTDTMGTRVTVLVTDALNSASTKIQKARKMNIPIIDSKQLLQSIGNL